MVLVHGERKKMGFLASKIRAELGVECYYPANGESLEIATQSAVPVLMSRQFFAKRQVLHVHH